MNRMYYGKSCLVQKVSHGCDQAEQKDAHYGAHQYS